MNVDINEQSDAPKVPQENETCIFVLINVDNDRSRASSFWRETHGIDCARSVGGKPISFDARFLSYTGEHLPPTAWFDMSMGAG